MTGWQIALTAVIGYLAFALPLASAVGKLLARNNREEGQ